MLPAIVAGGGTMPDFYLPGPVVAAIAIIVHGDAIGDMLNWADKPL